MAYEGDIKFAAGITQMNNQKYALVEASAVYVDDDTMLDEKLEDIDEAIDGITDAAGAANGLATLDSNGVLDSNQVPSYTVNVLEGYIDPSDGATITHFYAARSGSAPGYIYTDAYSPEANKFYTELTSNRIYRWNGSAYIEVSESLKIGTTSDTAFAGDKGQDAYAHAVTNKGSAFSSGFYKITTNAEGHVTHTSNVKASDITALGISDNDHTVSGVSYDTTNKKITQTINGTVTDVVSAATLKTDMDIAGDLNLKADKASPEFTGSISMQRDTTTTNPDTGVPYEVGSNSISEGYKNIASGRSSYAQGVRMVALGDYQHVFGSYNVANVIPYWRANTEYDVGDKVRYYKTIGEPPYETQVEAFFVCTNPNQDAVFTPANWNEMPSSHIYNSDYVEIVGNGTAEQRRSNARTLDWEGNEWLAGGLTVNQNGITIGSTTLTEADLIALLDLLNGQS